MSVSEKVWGAPLTSIIKLEDLTARVIRLEAQLELLTGAALVKQLKGG